MRTAERVLFDVNFPGRMRPTLRLFPRCKDGSAGIVAGAPQPPANVCDPSRGQEEASMLYPGGMTDEAASSGVNVMI